MCELETTTQFEKWLAKIRDKTVRNRLDVHLNRIVRGNLGDAKQLAPQLFELRFTFGGGIRIYYTIRGGKLILPLCGGDKSSQSHDIAQAGALLAELDNQS